MRFFIWTINFWKAWSKHRTIHMSNMKRAQQFSEPSTKQYFCDIDVITIKGNPQNFFFNLFFLVLMQSMLVNASYWKSSSSSFSMTQTGDIPAYRERQGPYKPSCWIKKLCSWTTRTDTHETILSKLAEKSLLSFRFLSEINKKANVQLGKLPWGLSVLSNCFKLV